MSGGSLVRVAVRDLVEFVCQSGDLRSTFAGAGRALAGTRGHQKIQKSRPEGYTPEVAISHVHHAPELSLELRGRIDGIWRQPLPGGKPCGECFGGPARIILEEIKTTTLPLTEITRDNQPLHWAQAKVYAYIFALQEGLETLSVRMTYLQLDTLEILEIRDEFSLKDLEPFFKDLVSQYLEWAATIMEWQRLRDASIAGLSFPFSAYREGQRRLAVAVYKAIEEGRNLFVQAPTGIGKTVATLFPALKALGKGEVAKIFYLTAKTVGRGVAEETLAGMSRSGLRCKVLTMTAKEKICFLPKPDCRPEACEFARGYYDRVKPALKHIFASDRFNREGIVETSREHRICPFEFSLFLALWADVFIGDYNYAFDPRVYLRRFFDPPSDEFAFLIDEAHNLPDRARDMFSADLLKSEFADARKELEKPYPAVGGAIRKITPFFRRLAEEAAARGSGLTTAAGPGTFEHLDRIHQRRDSSASAVLPEFPEKLGQALRKFLKVAEECLLDEEPSSSRERLLELFFSTNAFVRVSESLDKNYVCFVEPVPGRGRAADTRIRLFCLDPAALLNEALKRARSAVVFSATLLPLNYFFRILGGKKEDWTMTLNSPFLARQLKLLIIPWVRTELRVREKSFEAIAGIIHTAVSTRKGNYLVYFPSYRYLAAVRDIFRALHPEWRVIEQTTGMAEEARDQFLREFAADNQETLVGFVVMGGLFGEGIDLRGERLIGSIIVGVGLPQICLERDLIREHFQRSERSGFETAYRYPGMNRVLQAAGRVIRTEQDKGLVLLIDERFLQAGYRRLFPKEWSHVRTLSGKEAGGMPAGEGLKRELEAFWADP